MTYVVILAHAPSMMPKILKRFKTFIALRCIQIEAFIEKLTPNPNLISPCITSTKAAKFSKENFWKKGSTSRCSLNRSEPFWSRLKYWTFRHIFLRKKRKTQDAWRRRYGEFNVDNFTVPRPLARGMKNYKYLMESSNFVHFPGEI